MRAQTALARDRAAMAASNQQTQHQRHSRMGLLTKRLCFAPGLSRSPAHPAGRGTTSTYARLGWRVRAAVTALLVGPLSAAPAIAETAPRNIIFMIGDGMGPAYTTAYRHYRDDPATEAVEPTVFDELLVGMSSTHPADSTVVTDSAASGTALATGQKSYNGAIGVDVRKRPLLSVVEVARRRGMSVGIAVTSQVNHATPACFLAHVDSRKQYNAIADAYLDDRIEGRPKADVILGGGLEYFRRADRDLVAGFAELGFETVFAADELRADGRGPLLGLFAEVALPPALDDAAGPRLPAMTRAAIDRLDGNERGFFLLVEGSQIDWGGHANDVVYAMSELDEFAESVRLARDYAASRGDTLLLVTADHSTGGLTLGAGGEYQWRGDVVRRVRRTPAALAERYGQNSDFGAALSRDLGFDLSRAELAALRVAQLKSAHDFTRAIRGLIDQHSFTGWTTDGHTAVDVQVFAFGPGSAAFLGQHDNAAVGNALLDLLKSR